MTREELIARLEGRETGREIDADVHNNLVGTGQLDDQMYDQPSADVPDYSRSLDAALALVERVRPKAWIEINGPRRYLNIPTPVPNYWKAVVAPWEDKTEGVGWAATPAAALIAALLKAEG